MWGVSVPAGEEKGLGKGGVPVSAHLGFSADQPQMEGRRSYVKASGQSVITEGGQREALLGFRALQTSIRQRYWL